MAAAPVPRGTTTEEVSIVDVDESNEIVFDDESGDNDNDTRSPPRPSGVTREEARKRLQNKMRDMRRGRTARAAQTGLVAEVDSRMTRKQRRQAGKYATRRSVDDILDEFGLTSPDSKARVMRALESGEMKSLNDLVEFLCRMGGTMPSRPIGQLAETPNRAAPLHAQPPPAASNSANILSAVIGDNIKDGDANAAERTSGIPRAKLTPPPKFANLSTGKA